MSYENNALYFHSQRFEEYTLSAPRQAATVTFVLGYHGSADDFPVSLREDYAAADLVLHEYVAWTPDYPETLASAARGEYHSPSFATELNKRKIELVQNTLARQAMWDIPAAHTTAPRLLQYHFGGEFNRGITRLPGAHPENHSILEKYFMMIEARDKCGLKAITREINATETDTDAPLNVLVVAGLSHVGMANAYALLAEKEQNRLEVTISATHEQVCIDGLSSYIIARLQKGELSKDEVAHFAQRVANEEKLDMADRSMNEALRALYAV